MTHAALDWLRAHGDLFTSFEERTLVARLEAIIGTESRNEDDYHQWRSEVLGCLEDAIKRQLDWLVLQC
jgi:hypothetical protein